MALELCSHVSLSEQAENNASLRFLKGRRFFLPSSHHNEQGKRKPLRASREGGKAEPGAESQLGSS